MPNQTALVQWLGKWGEGRREQLDFEQLFNIASLASRPSSHSIVATRDRDRPCLISVSSPHPNNSLFSFSWIGESRCPPSWPGFGHVEPNGVAHGSQQQHPRFVFHSSKVNGLPVRPLTMTAETHYQDANILLPLLRPDNEKSDASIQGFRA